MRQKTYPYYLAGRPVQANTDLSVTNKYTGEPACRVALADRARRLMPALGRPVEAFRGDAPACRAYRRQEVLYHVVHRVTRTAFEELAQALCIEAGKPIRDARGEVTRLVDTFRVAAEECDAYLTVRVPSARHIGARAARATSPSGGGFPSGPAASFLRSTSR